MNRESKSSPPAEDALLKKLLESKNYRGVCPDTVRRIYAEYQKKYKKPKEAEKAAREQLHGITGAFMTNAEAGFCADKMSEWAQVSRQSRDAVLESLLGAHASTRERLPVQATDALFDRIFSATEAPVRVLDLACGINPVYLAARGIPALGVDISGASVELVNSFGRLPGVVPVSAICADLLCILRDDRFPPEHFSHALMFKLLPVLERQQTGAARALMERVRADYTIVSFPTRTLGGRNVGMEAHYAEWMEARLPARLRVLERFTQGSELIYILKEN